MKKLLTILGLGMSALWVQAQNVNLTFRVDMSNQTVSGNGVHVAGNWQAAAGFPGDWDPSTSELLDPENDNIYELTVSVPEGTYQYKFVNGNAWGSDEQVPGNCNVSGNREIVVGAGGATTTAFCYGTCTICLTQTNVTFRVDMSNVTPNPDGVSIAGAFQGWSPGQIFLTDPDNDNIYEVTVAVDQGTWQFKFINGTAWGFDESVPGECAVSNNREFTVGADPIVVQYCYAQCTATCNPDPSPAMVTFTVDMSLQEISQDGVFLMGSFTSPQWQNGAIEMDNDGAGIYSASVMVSGPATFQYKYANGDVFVGEETGNFIEGGCGVDNGFGGSNRIHTRSGEAEALSTVCFNACSDCSEVGTPASLTLLTLPCGGQVIQITGALAGSNGGGTATAETRTIYAFNFDNAGGTPTYTGSTWPYAIAPDGFTIDDAGITATITTNGNGVILVNGWPAYQYANDLSAADANGTFGPWNYYLPNGTLSQDACPCNVVGGTISTSDPRNNLCVGDGVANIVALQLTGNSGQGRFGLVRQSDLEVIAINSTGSFNMEQYPVGSYFVGYVSVPDLAAIAGITNVSQLTGCYDLSNQLPVTSAAVDGGVISTNGSTSGCLGSLTFTVVGQQGTTFRWALLNSNFTQIIDQNSTGIFDLSALANGTYRVAHVASRGVNLGTIVPPTLPACTDASNTILLQKSCAVGIAVSPNPTSGISYATFEVTEDDLTTLEVFDMSGRKVAELFRQNAQAGVQYRVEFDGSGLPNGVYVYRLSSSNEVIVQKFMIAE